MNFFLLVCFIWNKVFHSPTVASTCLTVLIWTFGNRRTSLSSVSLSHINEQQEFSLYRPHKYPAASLLAHSSPLTGCISEWNLIYMFMCVTPGYILLLQQHILPMQVRKESTCVHKSLPVFYLKKQSSHDKCEFTGSILTLNNESVCACVQACVTNLEAFYGQPQRPLWLDKLCHSWS